MGTDSPYVDRYGLTITTASAQAARLYCKAMDLILADDLGAESLLVEAIQVDPEFGIALMMLSRFNKLQGRTNEAKNLSEKAHACRLTAREKGHLKVLLLLNADQPVDAFEQMKIHLEKHPLDALIFSQLLLYTFFFGGRRKRDELTYWFDRLKQHYNDDWSFTGRLAFHKQELGRSKEAEKLAIQSLTANPRNAYAAHALLHVYHESNRHEETKAFCLKWFNHRSRQTSMYSHMRWHDALAKYAAGEIELAKQVYTEYVGPSENKGSLHLRLADAVGLFWKTRDKLQPSQKDREEIMRLIDQLKNIHSSAFVMSHQILYFTIVKDHEALQKVQSTLHGSYIQNDSQLTDVLRKIAHNAEAYANNEKQPEALSPEDLEGLGGSQVEQSSFLEFTTTPLKKTG